MHEHKGYKFDDNGVSSFTFLQEDEVSKPTYKDVLLMKVPAHRSGTKTSTQSIDYDHVLKQTNGCKLKDSWILLDNQSTVDVMQNPKLLMNIWQVATSMHIHCYAGVATTNWMGDLRRYGPVWFHKNGITNIRSLARVKEKYWVTYDCANGNEFQVHGDDGMYRVFRESSHGLCFMDVSNPLVSTVLVNMVAKNKAKCTQSDYSQAVLAYKVQKMIGQPSP
jgi:hypothetical protein